jgi:hypothetical protein
MDVPDLGKPETTVMISGAVVAVELRLNKRKGIAVSSLYTKGMTLPDDIGNVIPRW